ncbi:hypothetical protein MUK42_01560 [Musa troglodytarum]|uniref:5'-3' DNA helicase ZGRF1-like N-terminal domain-containing protein n=1 Tax=Musa troglodytarum TaxID=320322 RepID=A0A9E7FAA2_9LILI|nr:hypothetical protein MUK42_01560 [Musa troglodytarum]
MTSTRRWVVTYTKHLKQKRKTYHDGVLEISDSGNKVLLYDDSEKIIDSRFLKKDEVIESGGTLTFEAHLVDIGNLEEKGPFKNLNSSRNDSNLSEKAQNLQQKENEKSMRHNKLAQKYLSGANCKSRVNKNEPDSLGSKETHDVTHSDPKVNLFIFVFEKRDIFACMRSSIKWHLKLSKLSEYSLWCCYSLARCYIVLAILASTYWYRHATSEWNVLYTTQISQKAKKYHDGVLQLSLCGSHMNQIILLGEDGLVLSRKYLKSVECIRTGSKCELPNHLVEICEPRTRCEAKMLMCHAESLQKLPSKQLISSSNSSNNRSTKDICNTHLEQAVGFCSSDSVKSTDSSRAQINKPLRDACQILRTLKKPFPSEKNDPRNSPVVHANAPPSLDFVLPDAQCQSKDLNLQTGGNHKGDFSECASQTSLPGTPDIRSTSSQQVTHTEPKLEVDYLAITTSVERHNTSDHSSMSESSQGISADKCCSNVQVSRELAGFMNGNLPVREPCPSNGKEDTADPFANFLKENNTSDSSISGKRCNGTLNANEGKDEVTLPISSKDNEHEGRCRMVEISDASAATHMIRENFECQNSLNESLIEDVPTFDLGFY